MVMAVVIVANGGGDSRGGRNDGDRGNNGVAVVIG